MQFQADVLGIPVVVAGMAETTERVLHLLGLLQQRPVWTGPELAERLGVTTRSIRRDVERLRSLGYPVNAAQGVGGGYQLGRGKGLPPLLLDDAEAVAVAVSLRLAAGGTVSGASEAALRTLAKLDQVMPPRLRSEVRALHEATQTLDQGQATVDGDVLLRLARAVRDTVRVRFDYEARDGPTTSTARTGARSGSTGCRPSSPRPGGSARASTRTRATTSPAAWPVRRTASRRGSWCTHRSPTSPSAPACVPSC